MALDTSPENMALRMREFEQVLSYSGMSAACAAGLRPVRTQARKKNFGFTDRTKQTRKQIGPVRRYKASTARRYRGGGAYFRGAGRIGWALEYKFGRQYAFLEPAEKLTKSLQFERFLVAGRKEVNKAAAKARRLF